MPRLARWCARTAASSSSDRWPNSATNASVLRSADSRITPSKSNTMAPSGGLPTSVQLLDQLQEPLPHVDVVVGDQLAPRLGRVGIRRDAVVTGADALGGAVVDGDRAAEDL